MRDLVDLAVLGAWLRRNERRLARRLVVAVAALLVVALPLATLPSAPATAGGRRDRSGRAVDDLALIGRRTPSPTFVGSDVPGRAGVEASALALTAASGGLPATPGAWGPWVRAGDLAVGADRCPTADLEVSWRPPGDGYADGAYVEPLGPPPTAGTERVNGVVLCRSSHEAFLGFQAAWQEGRWVLSAVPSLDEETDGPLLEGEAAADGATPAPDAVAGDGASDELPAPALWADAPIEPLADYVPQTTCDPTAKPGVLGFRDLLLARFPGSRNLGIGRVCEAEGVSEHKEGRAFDWGVAADDPVERAEAEEVLAWLLGPDERGEPHAIARRLGLMYVIWDGQIWSSILAAEGWRPYVGRSEHRDHIHFSFGWDGALARTSFWQGGRAGLAAGSGAPDLPLLPVAPKLPALPALPLPPAFLPAPEPEAPMAPASSPAATTSTTSTTSPPPSSTTTTTEPPTTTTTTSPAPTPTLLSPPTTLGLGSL
jgi:hypothetical protein